MAEKNSNERYQKSILKSSNKDRIQGENFNDKEEYFSKHYLPPKKNENNHVEFEEIPRIKPTTEIKDSSKPDTLENEQARIRRCTTLEEINELTNSLLQKLRELKKDKLEKGRDISGDYDELKIMLVLVKETKEKILAKNKVGDIERRAHKSPTEFMEVDDFVQKEKIVSNDNLSIKDRNSNELDNIKSDECRQKISDNELKHVNSHDFVEYLLNKIHQRNFDILLLFHSLDFKKNVSLLNYFHTKLDEKNSSKIRFAVAFYNQNINGSNYFEISQFMDYKHYKTKILSNSNEIKSEILNLNWNHKSHKLVITLAKEGFVENFLNFLSSGFNKSLVNSMLNVEDEVSKQLKYQNVHFKKIDMKKNQIDQSIIDQVLGEYFLSIQTNDLCQEDYLKEMYFLKRNLFSSIFEHKNSRKEKVFPVKYDTLKRLKIYDKFFLDCETFKKESEFSNVKHDKTKQIILQFKGDILEPTRNLFLTWAKYIDDERRSHIWIEIFDCEQSLKRILDIHMTAEYLIETFKLKSASFKIYIAKIHRLLFDSSFITFVRVDDDLSKAEIKNHSESVYQVMECFTHFTYEKTNRTLIVIDLRTLQIAKNEFLITEPVVFSFIPERFSSSDLGCRGIENFKSQHKCNCFCREIGLKMI